MRRAGVVASGIFITLVFAGCASTGHTWKDEFTARLEGASAVIEEADQAFRTEPSDSGWPDVFLPLTRSLVFKGRLIERLHPPDGCERVQEEGKAAVNGVASVSYDLPKDMTPQLERDLPSIFDEELAKLKALGSEADTCARS